MQNSGNNSPGAIFLDRDGVINRRIIGDYVRDPGQFAFLPGVLEAIAIFSDEFKYIIVVTNQQGVGKGLMTEADVEAVHRQMEESVTDAGGRIDAVYFAPQLASENHPDRKPGIGMAMKALDRFPDINLKNSVMVGDSPTDMEFGRALGMHCVFIGNNQHDADADEYHPSLIAFAKSKFNR